MSFLKIKNNLSYCREFISNSRYLYSLGGAMLEAVFDGSNGVSADIGNYFYDVHGKLCYKIDDKNKVTLSYFNNGENLKLNEVFKDSASALNTVSTHYETPLHNTASALNWYTQVNNRLFSRTTLSYSRYSYAAMAGISDQTTYVDFDLKLALNDFSLANHTNYNLSSTHQLALGANYTLHHSYIGADVKVSSGNDIAMHILSRSNLHELHLYVDDNINLNKKLKIKAGLNLSAAFIGKTSLDAKVSSSFSGDISMSGKKLYFLPEPRLNIFYQVDQASTLKISSALMQKFVAVGYEQFQMVSDQIAPQKTWLSSLGLEHQIVKEDMRFIAGANLFYKKIFNVIGRDGSSATNKVDAQAYGIELEFAKVYGKLQGKFNYSLSWNTMSDKARASKSFYTDFDRRHVATLGLKYFKSPKRSIYVNVMYASGNPYSSYDYQMATLNPNGGYDYVLNSTEVNKSRYSDYFTIDAGFCFHKTKKKRNITWIYGVNNYRMNPVFPAPYKAFTPTISYNTTF